MTATCAPSANGRKESRRSLSQEIDRLDQMLDGLAEAIPATVADSIKESISSAVAEAVRATLLEIASRPEILASLRSTPEPDIAAPATAKPVTPSRVGTAIASAWKYAIAKLKAAAHTITAPVRGVNRAIHEINNLWSLRRPMLVALGVGAVVGIAGALAAPWLAGVLSGVGAAGTTLGAQFVAWSRRVCTSFGLG